MIEDEETSFEPFDEIEAVVVEEDEAAVPSPMPTEDFMQDDSAGDLAMPDGLTPDFSQNGILTVPIEVVVSVGKAQPLIRDFLNMRRDSLLVLDSKIDDPVEVRVAGRVIARGDLQEVPDQAGVLAVRLTEIVTYADM